MTKRAKPTARERELADELDARQRRRTAEAYQGIPERFQVDPLAADDDPDTAVYL